MHSQGIHKFEDLEMWKEGMRLASDPYSLLEKCKDFGLKDQMQRAAVSIPSNIAEGYERQTNKEFIRYLYISKGSSAELRTQLYLAIELGVIEKSIGDQLIEKTIKISSMLFKLIKTRMDKFSYSVFHSPFFIFHLLEQL